MFLCLLRSRPEWGPGGIIFIPQASYATQGTLAAQVVRGPLIRAFTIMSQRVWCPSTPDIVGADRPGSHSANEQVKGLDKGWVLAKDHKIEVSSKALTCWL